MQKQLIRNSTFIFWILVSQILHAGTTGKLAGRVTSKTDNNPLIGVNVIIEGTELGTATDIEGRYFILQIPPGAYTVRFTMIGYQDVIMRDVRIRVDLTTTIDTELKEGVIGMEAVDVTADRPMVQVDVTYSQANISSDEVNLLPVEEFEDVISLQAGVVQSGGEMHVRGGRGGEIAYMIDGVSVTDPFNADMAVEIENNAIQELQFISGTFNAEYGQAMSGIINIVTKDGDFSKTTGNVSVNGGSYFTPGQMMEADLLNENGELVKDSTMNLFPRLNTVDPSTLQDFQASISGPIIPGVLSLFASGRINKDQGYLFGRRLFVPTSHVWNPETNNFDLMTDADTAYWESVGDLPPDSAWVRMNWDKQESAQLKLSWRISPMLKLSYNFLGSRSSSQGFSRTYLWNPDGRVTDFTEQKNHSLKLDFSMNANTFFNVMLSQSNKNFKSHLSSDRNFELSTVTEIDTIEWNGYVFYDTMEVLESDIYNVNPDIFNYAPEFNYEVGGEELSYYNRSSEITTLKIEGTSQINQFHLLKSGLEYRKTRIEYEDVNLLFNDNRNAVFIPAVEGINHDIYGTAPWDKKFSGRNPIEYAAYLQDKIEFEDMVVNVGFRWDYFDPQWKTVRDDSDPDIVNPNKPINNFFDLDSDGEISEAEMIYGFINDSLKTVADRLNSNAFGDPWFVDVKPKTQISPRFALAFPITDTGFLHFSYGHFFAMPSFSYLYTNPEFEVAPGSGTSATMGNADMDPERTTQYEIGFSQQIGKDIGIEVTGYYKDIRNLNSTKIINSFVGGDLYGMYINQDHANSKGVTIALSKRPSGNISGNIDYTFSISEGNASDPQAAFLDEQSNIEPEKILVPLDWDQRHTLNATLTYHPVKNSGISIIYSFGSGLPYTADFAGVRTSFENNARKPSTMDVDMRSFYNFELMGIGFSMHLNVYNLFDIRNELSVNNDTGRATYSLIPTYTPQVSGPGYNTLDQYLINPANFSSPRQIKFGISLNF